MRLVVAFTHCLDPEHEEELEDLEKRAEDGPPVLHEDSEDSDQVQDPHTKKLMRMGLSTALAITLHNLPEGLAGMVAGLLDPSVGFTLTFAIAIHNIPEGLCISLPVFYSTGSRWKGRVGGLIFVVHPPHYQVFSVSFHAALSEFAIAQRKANFQKNYRVLFFSFTIFSNQLPSTHP